MSNTKREPLLSDDEALIMARKEASNWRVGNQSDAVVGAEETILAVRKIYESARAKDAELIQMLVDALANLRDIHEERAGREPLTGMDELAAAAAAEFKPSDP
jgi:hypothetical protein